MLTVTIETETAEPREDLAGALVVFKCYYLLMSRAWQAGEEELSCQEAASVLQLQAGKTPPSHPALPARTAERGFLPQESGVYAGR